MADNAQNKPLLVFAQLAKPPFMIAFDPGPLLYPGRNFDSGAWHNAGYYRAAIGPKGAKDSWLPAGGRSTEPFPTPGERGITR